jgi:hypothetical protein
MVPTQADRLNDGYLLGVATFLRGLEAYSFHQTLYLKVRKPSVYRRPRAQLEQVPGPRSYRSSSCKHRPRAGFRAAAPVIDSPKS